jgi:hypothetical protein
MTSQKPTSYVLSVIALAFTVMVAASMILALIIGLFVSAPLLAKITDIMGCTISGILVVSFLYLTFGIASGAAFKK